MERLAHHPIATAFAQYLEAEENLVSVGGFKKVPTTSFFLLTRGIAWMLTQDFYVGVTNQRIIVLPVSQKRFGEMVFDDAFFVSFDAVELTEDLFNNTILKIQKLYRGYHLKLRFKTRDQTADWNPFEFIAAVQHGKQAAEKIQP